MKIYILNKASIELTIFLLFVKDTKDSKLHVLGIACVPAVYQILHYRQFLLAC